MKIGVNRDPKSEMEEDLGKKFTRDLQSLMTRSIDVMREGGLDRQDAVNLVMTALAHAMVSVELAIGERGLAVRFIGALKRFMK